MVTTSDSQHSIQWQDIVFIENNMLCAPAITMHKDDKQVVILGVSHIASAEFFQKLQSILTTYEDRGYRILHEVVSGNLGLELPENANLAKEFKKKIDELDTALAKYGLRSQAIALIQKPNWIAADFTYDDWSREIPNILPISKKMITDMDAEIPHVKSLYVDEFVKIPDNLQQEVPELNFARNARNKVAVQCILSQLKHTNVCTYWGLTHVPGIRDLLLKEGFSIQKKEWNPFFKLPENLSITV